jgi:hypothetical protein
VHCLWTFTAVNVSVSPFITCSVSHCPHLLFFCFYLLMCFAYVCRSVQEVGFGFHSKAQINHQEPDTDRLPGISRRTWQFLPMMPLPSSGDVPWRPMDGTSRTNLPTSSHHTTSSGEVKDCVHVPPPSVTLPEDAVATMIIAVFWGVGRFSVGIHTDPEGSHLHTRRKNLKFHL